MGFLDDLNPFSGGDFNPSTAARDWTAMGTGGLSELGNYLSGNRLYGGGPPNPADSAMGYLNQIPGQLHDIYDPYMKQGQDAYGRLSGSYNSMSSDPAGYLNDMMKNYAPSKSFQMQNEQALKSAGNTAAAGGMRGSLNDIQNSAKITDMLMGNDMQQWLQNTMGIQNRGLNGLQNFYNTGYNAANSMGGDLSNVLGTKAQLGFQGQAQQNQSDADWRKSLMGLLGMGAGAAMGGFGGAGASASAGSGGFFPTGNMISGGNGGSGNFV